MNDPAANFNPRTDSRECAPDCDCHAPLCPCCGLEMAMVAGHPETWRCLKPLCADFEGLESLS